MSGEVVNQDSKHLSSKGAELGGRVLHSFDLKSTQTQKGTLLSKTQLLVLDR